MHAEKFKSHKFLLDLRGKAQAHSKCPQHNADLTAVNCLRGPLHHQGAWSAPKKAHREHMQFALGTRLYHSNWNCKK